MIQSRSGPRTSYCAWAGQGHFPGRRCDPHCRRRAAATGLPVSKTQSTDCSGFVPVCFIALVLIIIIILEC